MRTFVSAVVSAAVCAWTLSLQGAVTARSYVQDGLVGLWDAEENVGWGQHSATPEVWKNLVDASVEGRVPDFQLPGAGTFEAKAFYKSSSGIMASNAVEVSTEHYFKTIEVVVSDIPASDKALAIWGTFEHHVAIWDAVKAADGKTYRNVTTSYYVQHGLQTPNRPKVSSISVTYMDEYSSFFGRQIIRATDVKQGGDNETMVNNGQGDKVSTLAVGGLTGATDFRSTTGYRIHSIRLYNRVLTETERQANLIVDSARFDASVFVISGDTVWTGGAGDGRFSSAANWNTGIPLSTGVRYERIRLSATNGTETIVNDAGVVTAECVRVEQAADHPTQAVTLRGGSFTLTSASCPWATASDAKYPLVTECPLTIDADVTFTGSRGCSRATKNVVYEKPVVIQASNQFYIQATDSATHTFNGSVTAPDATFVTSGGQHDYFNGPVFAKLLKPGGSSSLEYFHFTGTGSDWSGEPYLYGGLYADARDAFPSNLVFRWTANAGTDNKDQASLFYSLRYDQTCDRMESSAVIGQTAFLGLIRERNRIASDTRDVTLTLRGTADATHYGHLKSANSRKLNLVWDPTGPWTQSIGDIQQTMIGELIVKGGTLASLGTNGFPNVTALRIADGATFAVRASDYNSAANPFPGTTDLWISGAGRVEVAAGVTVTVRSAFVAGVMQAARTFQAEDGTHATAEKVGWVTGDGLVSVALCDGTSWKSAATSGDWNDAARWTDGVPPSDGSKKAYLTAEGAAYTVTMKDGDAWPRNILLRGANATLAVGAGQTVEYDGTSKTSSVTLEDGATLAVAGELTLTNYVGTFTVGSTSAATSRVAVAATGRLCYAPTAGSNNPMTLNPNGALEIAGGTVVMPGEGYDILKMAGGVLKASGDGVFCYGGRAGGQEFWLTSQFQSGEMVFGGNATFTNFPGKAQGLTFAPSTAGESLLVTFRDRARYGLCIDGLRIGSGNTHTVVDFGSAVEHRMLGTRVCVRATGGGTAEMRLSKGRVSNDGRGLDVGFDDKVATEAHGRLVQTGGFLYNYASNGAWTDHGMPNGFNVGFGATAPVSSGTVAYGEMFLSGGTNENCGGVTLVGAGYAQGTVVQTGGEYWHDSTGADSYRQVFGIGAAGGEGNWTVSNGTLVVKKTDVYVGGFHTNLLTLAERMTRWPDTRHDAEGTLTVAGGTVDFRAGLVIGADGRGTVNVIGSSGAFTVGGDLVFSNHVANAQSGGTLNFVLDEGGVRPLTVAGRAVFRPGAKMTVDIGRYAGTRGLCLLRTADGLENPIAAADVELKGATGPLAKAAVRQTATGYRLVLPNGFGLILR